MSVDHREGLSRGVRTVVEEDFVVVVEVLVVEDFMVVVEDLEETDLVKIDACKFSPNRAKGKE